MLSPEEIQKTLSASMMSMQEQMEKERKNYKEKIKKLEDENAKKDEQIEELKHSLTSKKDEDDMYNKIIANLNGDIRKKEKELDSKKEEHQKDVMEISNLNNQ